MVRRRIQAGEYKWHLFTHNHIGVSPMWFDFQHFFSTITQCPALVLPSRIKTPIFCMAARSRSIVLLTTDITGDITRNICHLNKLRPLYRHLYTATEILYLWHRHTCLLKPFTDILEATSPCVDEACLEHSASNVSVSRLRRMFAIQHLSSYPPGSSPSFLDFNVVIIYVHLNIWPSVEYQKTPLTEIIRIVFTDLEHQTINSEPFTPCCLHNRSQNL